MQLKELRPFISGDASAKVDRSPTVKLDVSRQRRFDSNFRVKGAYFTPVA
jgi:hypothetical protein